ncbi:MAG: single-stranded-DNA-specific exonuclease RecJ, partial [Longimicrobiales bacterium]
PGLNALIRAANLRRRVDATTIAYVLAPRINAAGRVGETEAALRLLTTSDGAEAEALAARLERDNRDRRALDKRTLNEALEQVGEGFDPERDRGLVIAGDGWHPGVIGIVASRIVERVFRPAVLVALNGDQGRGSARSIPGFHLYDAIAACAGHLDRFGGHQQAAGLDIKRNQLGAFREAFQAAAADRLVGHDLQPGLEADLEIRLDEIPGDFYRYLQYVGPFGQGNPEPVFVTRGVHFDAPPSVTTGGHLKFSMVQEEVTLGAIGFGLGDHVPLGELGTGLVDVAYTLSENTYGGSTTVQARALDVRPAA